MRLFLSISLIFLLAISCKKESRDFKKIEYQVVVYPGNEVGITYNSDYNIDSDKRKEIIINDNNNNYSNNIWSAIHVQKADEPYYIKVDYKIYNNPQSLYYGVFVFINDTLVDEKITNNYTPSIELTGKVYED